MGVKFGVNTMSIALGMRKLLEEVLIPYVISFSLLAVKYIKPTVKYQKNHYAH